MAISQPTEYDELVIKHFRHKYGAYIQKVFKKINDDLLCDFQENSKKSVLENLNHSKIERHLFPFFAAASASGKIVEDHIEFGANYVLLISLPVLTMDRLVDKNSTIFSSGSKKDFEPILTSFASIYAATANLSENPKFTSLLKTLSGDYSLVFQSLIEDIHTRYNVSCLEKPGAFLKQELNSPSSQFTSKYFKASIISALVINDVVIDGKVTDFVNVFGTLRQCVDHIADVREDLSIGKVTLPVIFALLNDSTSLLRHDIEDFWNSKPVNKLKLEGIVDKVQKFKGFDGAYDFSLKIYEEARSNFRNLPLNIASPEIEALLILKRAYLERIKSNHWQDCEFTKGL